MKNKIRYSLFALFAVVLVMAGCSKAGESGARVPLPDISDFTIQFADPFVKGGTSKVHVYCSTIGSGTYQVHYDLGGYNVLKSQTSTLVMQNNTGTFTTPKLANAGQTFLTINSITNSKGGGTMFLENNKYTISDSTGVMVALVDSYIAFKATNLSAVVDGQDLTITGSMPEPYKSSITLRVNKFNGLNGIFNFTARQVPQQAQGQYASERYPGGGFLSSYGQIHITSITPTLTGTFYFTGMDSTRVEGGSFDVYTPE